MMVDIFNWKHAEQKIKGLANGTSVRLVQQGDESG